MKTTAKQLKAKAPFFWAAVEDAVYDDCVSASLENSVAITEKMCRRIAHNAAFVATSEFVGRAGK